MTTTETTDRGSAMDEYNNEKRSVLGFYYRTQGDHIGAYAASAAYFLILSFFPLILFLTTLIRYTPLTYGIMMQAVNDVIPDGLQDFVTNIIRQVYYRNATLLPLTAVTTIWSAGKGLQAITNGLNCIYHVRESRNWLQVRLYSILYTFLFGGSLVGCLLVMLLGYSFQKPLLQYAPILGKLLGKLLASRKALLIGVLFSVILFLYKILPNRKTSLRSQIPGAALTTAAWIGFSFAVSVYFKFYSKNYTYIYGSMAGIIVLFLWIYGCMLILLYGAAVNSYFEQLFRFVRDKLRRFFARKKRTEETEGKEIPDEDSDRETDEDAEMDA